VHHGRASDTHTHGRYGVTVWEVMTDGALPFSELGSLNVVAEHIKGAGVLRQPAGCPRRVYAGLMVPCWDPDPKERPSFDELNHAARSLGGVISDKRQGGSPTGTQAGTQAEESKS
jgi:hypothetical protein